MRELNPIDVSCPFCKAAPSSPCFKSERDRTPIEGFHLLRAEKAHDYLKNVIEENEGPRSEPLDTSKLVGYGNSPAAPDPPKPVAGAAYNELIESETKESLALQVVKLLGDLRRAHYMIDAREGYPNPTKIITSGEDFHFEDAEVLGAIVATDYYKNQISHCLHTLTSGEKWSLYRAVVALADLQRSQNKGMSLSEALANATVIPGELCGDVYALNPSRACDQPKGHSGPHSNERSSFSWLGKEQR